MGSHAGEGMCHLISMPIYVKAIEMNPFFGLFSPNEKGVLCGVVQFGTFANFSHKVC